MKGGSAPTRVHSLVLWIGSRLATRQAITWVTKALKGEKGLSDAELVSLLSTLSDQAGQRNDLPEEIKEIWQLFYRAARDRQRLLAWYHVEQFKRDIRQGNFSAESVKTLVDFARPRLKPSEPSRFVIAEEGFQDHPRRWVIWGFEAASGSVDHGIAKLDRKLLSSLPSALLAQILIESTSALETALDVAQQAGWMRDGRDLANSFVARIAFEPTEGETVSNGEEEDDKDDRDPDAYHDGFAPLLRLMTAAFDALKEKDVAEARRVVGLWEGRSASLFVRLQAYAGLDSSIWDARQVAQFLSQLHELTFWRWSAFPEVAQLRASRWKDLSVVTQAKIADRLVNGPVRADLDPDNEISQEALSYWRDHEIARVVDNNRDVPKQLSDAIESRRNKDADFPIKVPVIEVATGVRFRRVPDGDEDAFSNVNDDNLVAALAAATRERSIGEGDNALAYARKNRRKIIELLARHKNSDDDIATVWELVLSYPHDKPDDLDMARETAQFLANVSLALDDVLFERIADRLSYWLDATDEQIKDFPGAVLLWERLLPLAVLRENAQHPNEAVEADLSSAALNVPLGHLLSFFFRRCPTMPAQGEKPPLPQHFVVPLKALQGRARALLANRMAVTLNYFWRADADWLRQFVLDPMLSNTSEGIGLWEAFAKYGPVPSPPLWQIIQASLIKHVASGRLSKEALRRLVEMLIVVWSWTKTADTKYAMNAAELRGALSISSDEVRAAAAWQFLQLIDRDDREDDEVGTDQLLEEEEGPKTQWSIIGSTFFSEVWPMEPAVQSPQSANDFARIPARVGSAHYSDAVKTIIPLLRPFDVWDVDTAFGLTKETNEIVRVHPTETLALIAACVPDDQKHAIYRLGRVLALILEAKPELAGDPEFRRLRRFVPSEEAVAAE